MLEYIVVSKKYFASEIVEEWFWWASTTSKDTHKWYKSPLNRSLVDMNRNNFGESDGDTMYMPAEELLPWEKFSLNSANGGGKKVGAASTYASLALLLGFLTRLMVWRNMTEAGSLIYGEGRIRTIYTCSHLSSWIHE